MIRRLSAALAAVLILGPLAQRLPGSEVRDELARAIKEIAQLIKDEKQREAAISEITGPPAPKTSAGPMIQAVLIEELKELKVAISDDAFVFVGGNYFILQDDTRPEELIVRL